MPDQLERIHPAKIRRYTHILKAFGYFSDTFDTTVSILVSLVLAAISDIAHPNREKDQERNAKRMTRTTDGMC